MASEGLVSAELTLTADDLPQPGKQFTGNFFIFCDSWEEKNRRLYKMQQE